MSRQKKNWLLKDKHKKSKNENTSKNKGKNKQRTNKSGSHESPYARKERLRKEGIYSSKSPLTLISFEGEPVEDKPKPPETQKTLLTKTFNKGANVRIVRNFRNNKNYTFPNVPKEFKNMPCALMAEQKNNKWFLSRQYKAHEDKKWYEEKLPTNGEIESKEDIKSLLSKWSYVARFVIDKEKKKEGTLPHGLANHGDAIVGNHASLSYYEEPN